MTANNSGGIIKEKQYKRFDIEDQQGYDNWQKSYYALNKPKLTSNDVEAIKTYTDGSYSAINAATRFEKGSIQYNKVCKQYGEENLDKYKAISDNIASAIEKFELNDNIVCHRYVPAVDYITGSGSSLEDLQKSIGGQYTDKGFTSTCLFENLTKSFGGKTPIHLEIRVPKGSSGAYINEFSEKKNKEFEFLLNRGTKFRIVDAGKRKTVESKWIISDREWREVEVKEKFMILEVLS